jgi:hypothetical protein
LFLKKTQTYSRLMFEGTKTGLLYYNHFPILRYWVYLIKVIQETLALKYISTYLLHHLVSIYHLLRNHDPLVKSLDHWFSLFLVHTVKPAHMVTSIKQLLVLKCQPFLYSHRKCRMNWTSFRMPPVLSGHLFFVPVQYLIFFIPLNVQ